MSPHRSRQRRPVQGAARQGQDRTGPMSGGTSSALTLKRETFSTEEEVDFLLHRRVELNALASEDLVSWIER
jgi:hypothetical protein